MAPPGRRRVRRWRRLQLPSNNRIRGRQGTVANQQRTRKRKLPPSRGFLGSSASPEKKKFHCKLCLSPQLSLICLSLSAPFLLALSCNGSPLDSRLVRAEIPKNWVLTNPLRAPLLLRLSGLVLSPSPRDLPSLLRSSFVVRCSGLDLTTAVGNR